MGTLTLHRDHIVARWYAEEETVRPAGILDLSRYFFYTVTIDPRFTLGDLFALLDREGVGLLETVLGEQVEPILEEARTAVGAAGALGAGGAAGAAGAAGAGGAVGAGGAGGAPPGGQMEFLRVFNVHEGGRLHRDFEGWGAWTEPYEGAWEEHPAWPRSGSIGVSLSPMNELLNLPLRYDPQLVFRDEDGHEEYRTTITITLIELLKAVFFELTFHGTPQERDGMRGELRKRMEAVERGEARLIPAEEVSGAEDE